MAQATTVDMKLVKRSILLVDIVDYSELDGPEQVAAIEKLNAAVRSALKALYKKGLRKKDVKCLPTGDGMFIAVPTGIEVLDLARGIHATPGSFRAVLKIGINEGYVFIVRDIEDRPNLFGAGINFAARVESCCAGGHILVADTVAKDLLTANQQLKADFKGPYTFRVKHDKPVTAYNYYRLDEFGLADEPMKNRIPENINYEPLIDRLVARGLRPSGALQEAVFASRLSHNHNPIFGDMFQLTAILGYAGIDPSKLTVTTHKSVDGFLPRFIVEARKKTVIRGDNRAKVFLKSFTPAVLDQGTMDIEVAMGDYRTSRTIRQVIGTIHEKIRLEEIDPLSFCARLNLQVVAITADNRLLLGRRRAGLDDDPETWSILGESIDGDKDLNSAGEIRPESTVFRALYEDDELGIEKKLAKAAKIRFIALARKGSNLLTDLVAIAEMSAVASHYVFDHFKPGEHTHLDAVPFTVDDCLVPLVLTGRHQNRGDPSTAADVNQFSRYGIFCALCYRFGYHEVVGHI